MTYYDPTPELGSKSFALEPAYFGKDRTPDSLHTVKMGAAAIAANKESTERYEEEIKKWMKSNMYNNDSPTDEMPVE